MLFDAVHVPSAVVWDVPAVTFDAVVVPATPFREVVTILFELVTERLLTYCNLPVAVEEFSVSVTLGCVTEKVASAPMTLSVVGLEYPVTAAFVSVEFHATAPPDAEAPMYPLVLLSAVIAVAVCLLSVTSVT